MLRRHPRFSLAIISVLGLASFFVWWTLAWPHTSPNSYLGHLPTSFHNPFQVSLAITNLEQSPIVLELDNGQTIQTTLGALNLPINYSQTIQNAFSPNGRTRVNRLIADFFSLNLKPHQLLSFDQNVGTIQYVHTPLEDSPVIFDNASKQFSSSSLATLYHISLASIIDSFAHSSPNQPLTIPAQAINFPDPRISQLNDRLAQTLTDPIEVRIKNGKSYYHIPISSHQLRDFIFATSSPQPTLSIQPEPFNQLILQQTSPQQQADLNLPIAVANVNQLLNQRFQSSAISTVVLGIDDGPTTDGSKSSKYLEVDLSQQKLYAFENGQVVRQFRISSGKLFPTPIGDYHIMNKAPMAFSNPYQVWMPYWMAFSQDQETGYYLGIHEIAYLNLLDGVPQYRAGNYIGERGTAGCIALNPGEAKNIYDFSEVGMLISIVP